MRRWTSVVATCFVCGAVGSTAQAQIRPLLEGPGRTRPELPPPPEPEERPEGLGRILPEIEIPEEDTEAGALAGGELSIRGFRFEGNTVFSDAQLSEVTRPYVGDGRHYTALLEARDRITRAYVDAGYISSGAVLPPQSLEGGIVEIRIVEGRITQVRVEDAGRLRDHYVASRLIGSDAPLDVDVLRDRLTWLKRDPRIDAITAELVPGDAPGSSRLSVVVDEARPWWVSAQADNATPPSIGEYGGLFQVGHRNLTGWGDSLMISFRQTEGLSDVEGYFEVPLTRWETTLELRGRYADADVVEPELSQLELNSEATVLGARIRQPVLRSSNYEARLFVGIERKTGRATLGGDPGLLAGLARDFGTTRTAAVRMGAEAWWRGRHRAFAGRGTLSLGFDGFGASNGTSFSQPNEEFVTGLVQLQGVEYLPWYRLRIHTRLDFQITDGPLLSLEQLAMGGVDSVRGFRENILVRDEGVVASLEVRVPLWTFGPVERFELGVFTDYGYGRNQKGDLPFKLRSERLMSVGLGLHADVTPWIQASAQWAGEILEPSGNDGDGDGLQDHGFHFLLRVFFP